ncbi:MAG: histidine kinase, partial [Calditrichota bacterium]
IELQRLRLTEKTHLEANLSIDESTASKTKIAPMLFIPFIENAFKYGVSPSLPTEIDISLTEADNELRLFVKNTRLADKGSIEAGGIGLKNVQSRLKLIYPNRHSLSVQETDLAYIVNLSLRLKS